MNRPQGLGSRITGVLVAAGLAVSALTAGAQAPSGPKLDTNAMWQGCELQKEAITGLLKETQQENARLKAEIEELKKAKASN